MFTKFANAIKSFVLDKPKTSILFSVLVAGIMIPMAAKMSSDFSYRIWFHEGDPLLERFDAFERRFGNDENMVIIIHSENGVFDKKSVQKIQQFTEDMWRAPNVIRVDSISNHNFTSVDGDSLSIDPFLPDDIELSETYLLERKKTALKDETINGYLLSPDAKTAVIYARMKPALDKIPTYQDTTDYIREKAKIYQDEEDQVMVTGSASINVTFQEVSVKDMEKMVPILILLVILFLIYAFRGLAGVLLPSVVIIFTIGATFGFGGAQGITFNVMLSAVPNTLIAICIADVVHILMTYVLYRKQGIENSRAVRMTLDKNFVPTFLTTLSTMIGFFSLIPAKIAPISEMGILDGFGTLMAWFFTIFLVIPLLVLFPFRKVKVDEESLEGERIHPLALRYSKWIQSKRMPIIIIGSIIVIGSFFTALKNQVNSDPFEYFTDDVPLKIANKKMESAIGGSMGAQIVFESGIEDGVKDPEFIKKMEQVQKTILERPFVTQMVSITDILKNLNRSLNGGNQDQYILADDRETIAQQLFLYTMSLPQGMDINDQITLKNDAARVSVLMNIHDSKRVLAEFAEWEKLAAEQGISAKVTGKIPLYQNMNGYVVETFFTSISMALLLVCILMILVFKSWKLGLISMIPNTVPLIIGGALMYLLSKPIDMGTVVVIAVCLGIAVDDTIHFLANFKKYISKGKSPVEAIALVFSYTGPALLLTTLILVVGFGTFIFAQFLPNVNFGIMTATILVTALVCDFTLLPAILLPKNKTKT
ncbi:MAG: RND family transporter [Bdellovibrionales bacterium]